MLKRMKLYPREIIDGLKEQMEAQSSIAFECDIINPTDDIQIPFVSVASEVHGQQSDLYYLNSVLASAGWNKNDDVFSAQELWNARNTPVNKQFNNMHDDNDIIGHITGSTVVDHSGKHITDESQLSENIDIITSAVIYRMRSDAEVRDRIATLIDEIEKGQWSVSMECIFSDFDYAIITPDNTNRVIARDEESAFLTKHLRAYGGTGEFQGHKVGRLFKSYYFSGKGLVNKPANSRSIILNRKTNPFDTKQQVQFNTFLSAMEVYNMPDPTQQVEDFEAKASAIQAQFDAYKVEAEAAQSAAKAEIQSYETKLAEKEASLASLQTKVSELESSYAAMKESYDKTMKDMKNMKRKDKLAKAGASDELSESIMSKFEDVTEDQFDLVVALMADKFTSTTTEQKPSAPVEEPETQADASVLDDVQSDSQATASLANPTESTEDQNRSIAASAAWLRESVLRTTKNLK